MAWPSRPGGGFAATALAMREARASGRLAYATLGPVALAKRWEAALLPTFTLRASDGSFDVTIGAPLESNKDDMAAYCEDSVTQYAQQLEPIFLADPTQWRGWRLFLPKAENTDVPRHSAT